MKSWLKSTMLAGLVMIKGVKITSLNIINVQAGNVLHGLKASEECFKGFGEAYFSEVHQNSIKAWKRHKEMTLNILVPFGSIRFVLFDNRIENNSKFQEIIISRDNYCRLSVPPMIWMGFQGLTYPTSILMNIANIEHNPEEVENLELNKIDYDWSRK